MRAQTGKVKYFDVGHGDCVALGDVQDTVRCVIEVVSPTTDQHVLIVYGLPPDEHLPFESSRQGRVGLEQGPVMLGPYRAQCHHMKDGKKPLKIYFDKIPFAGTAWHGTPSILDDNMQFVIECRDGERFGLCTMAITRRDADTLGLQLTWMPGSKTIYFELTDGVTWSSPERDVNMQFYAAKDADGRMHLWVIGARNNQVALLGNTVATGETIIDKKAMGTAPTIVPRSTTASE